VKVTSSVREWDSAMTPPEEEADPPPKKMGRKAKIQPGVTSRSLPLDYMLAVIRDPGAGVARRDRMAIAAAPYCHPRVAYVVKGKKDAQAEAAATAGAATEWASDLEFDGRAN
jgi:hypothetical protein